MGFYEEIAGQYDNMTRFHERMPKETAMLQHWIERYGFRSVLDVACGTGLHAIALARLGIKVAGADISDIMLDKARSHAAEFGVQIPWVQASMQQLQRHFHETFEAIFCLGNSIPHLLQQADLEAACVNLYGLLGPGGILVLQVLNYHRILADQERIIGIHRQGDTVYIRFYDFQSNQVIFNVLTAHFQHETCTHSLQSTPLYPYRKDELEHGLSQHGFTDFESYGDMQFHPFEEQTSTNLVLVARK
jgi:glycine/sarcosine N-methyltransferase